MTNSTADHRNREQAGLPPRECPPWEPRTSENLAAPDWGTDLRDLKALDIDAIKARAETLNGLSLTGDPAAVRYLSDVPALVAEIERLHSWDGLMSLLDEHWPEDIFPTLPDDEGRDDGARIVSLLRWVNEAITREVYDLVHEGIRQKRRAIEAEADLAAARDTLARVRVDACEHCGDLVVDDGQGQWSHYRGPGSRLNNCQHTVPYGFNATPAHDGLYFPAALQPATDEGAGK